MSMMMMMTTKAYQTFADFDFCSQDLLMFRLAIDQSENKRQPQSAITIVQTTSQLIKQLTLTRPYISK